MNDERYCTTFAKCFNLVFQCHQQIEIQEMGTPDHLTCLVRNIYAGQEAIARTRHGKMTGSKLGKEYVRAVYCHPAYLTYVQSTSGKMLG